MDQLLGIWILVGCIALIAFIYGRLAKREADVDYTPSSRLEKLIERAVDLNDVGDELYTEFMNATVFGMNNAEPPHDPMTFSIEFDPAIAGDAAHGRRPSGGDLQFGPYVFCYTSKSAMEFVRRANPIMKVALTNVAQYPGKLVLECARREKVDVMLNAFLSASARISPETEESQIDERSP